MPSSRCRLPGTLEMPAKQGGEDSLAAAWPLA
jgi:hypothetical protein